MSIDFRLNPCVIIHLATEQLWTAFILGSFVLEVVVDVGNLLRIVFVAKDTE